MHVVISKIEVISYKVNEQERYRMQVLQIFHNKNALGGKTRYSLYSFCRSTNFKVV